MINKKLYALTTIINIVYLGVLTFKQDPFKENYSMMTSSLFGYLVVLTACALLSFNFYCSYKTINNKIILFSLGPIIGCLLPYFDGKGDIISNLHIIGAYIGFGLTCGGTLLNIFKYRSFNYKKSVYLLRIFIVIFAITLYFYLDLLGVTSIQQFLLLSTCLLINLYIVLNTNY